MKMKTLNLSAGAVILGALGASFAACSPAESAPAPGGNNVSGSVANTAGTTGIITGTAGTASPAAGTTGVITGTGGVTGTGGNASAGGTNTGTGGTGTGGTSAGGAAPMSCGMLTPTTGDAKCCVAAGTAADVAIDDLEDGNNVILPVGQRQGYWYTYGVKEAMQTPLPTQWMGTAFVPGPGGSPCSLMPLTAACKAMNTAAMGTAGSMLFSAETKGSLPPATDTVPTYAGMGVDLNNHFAKSCVYDGKAYKGISFYAKGSAFKVAVAIPGTVPTTSDSGACAAMCSDHFNMLVAPPPDGSWKQFTINWTDLTQAGWGTVAMFDASKLINIQFQVDGLTTATATAPFDFSVDDLAFVP
jgi:hypothetical protein